MSNLKGIQKSAILLAALGEEAAAEVLKLLDEEEQERLGQAMLQLEEADVGEEYIVEVLEEFKKTLLSGSVLRSQMGRSMQRMMERVYGPEEGRRRCERIRTETADRFPFRGLRGINGADLARVLREEHPQVQALVLSHLDSAQAAEVLEEFPEKEQVALVYRMATMEEPTPRLLRYVAQGVIERTRGLRREEAEDPMESDPRLRVVADILNATDSGVDKEILEAIEEQDEEMVTRIRERMFTWEDLVSVDRRTMQKILAGIDTKLLALALKASDDKVKEALLSATSQRTRDMILEERELIGAVPVTDVMDAQRQILSTIRELMDSGEINLSKGKGAVFVE